MARIAKNKTNDTVSKEVSAAIKSFKASSDIENFYRFIHENNLRSEAESLIKVALNQISGPKRRKKTLQ